MVAKLLSEFKPRKNAVLQKDPKSNAAYVEIPKLGVRVGWAVDRTFPVFTGDIVGFHFPLEKAGGTSRSYACIGRALSLAVKGGAGEMLDPVCINMLVWGPELGHVYQRFVQPVMCDWVRSPGRVLDEWFFSDELKFSQHDMLLRMMSYGALTDHGEEEYFFGPYIKDIARLQPPRKFPHLKSKFIAGPIVCLPESEFEDFLKYQRADPATYDPEELVDLFYDTRFGKKPYSESFIRIKEEERSALIFFAERLKRSCSHL